MKKFLSVLILAVIVMFTATSVMAQPFPAGLSTDPYDSTPDAIITPNDDNDGTPDVNDAVNMLLGTTFANNEDVDHLQTTTGDVVWKDLSSTDTTGTFILIGLTAARRNTLNVYGVPGPVVDMPVIGPVSGFGFAGDGSFASPFIAGFSPLPTSSNFGFSLTSIGNPPDRRWDSKPSENSDGFDHMLTYHLEALGTTNSSVWIQSGCTFDDSNPAVGDVVCTTVEEYFFQDPYLIVWEDRAFDPLTGTINDEDYDDIIFLVDRVAPVPEPMSLMLLGSGLAGLASVRRRKRS